jgi:hypothetical protein
MVWLCRCGAHRLAISKWSRPRRQCRRLQQRAWRWRRTTLLSSVLFAVVKGCVVIFISFEVFSIIIMPTAQYSTFGTSGSYPCSKKQNKFSWLRTIIPYNYDLDDRAIFLKLIFEILFVNFVKRKTIFEKFLKHDMRRITTFSQPILNWLEHGNSASRQHSTSHQSSD